MVVSGSGRARPDPVIAVASAWIVYVTPETRSFCS
jgi:hypothetical protein